jgi:hypothetical protein
VLEKEKAEMLRNSLIDMMVSGDVVSMSEHNCIVHKNVTSCRQMNHNFDNYDKNRASLFETLEAVL